MVERLKFEIINTNPILFSAMGVGEPILNTQFDIFLKEYKNNRLAFSTLVPFVSIFKGIVNTTLIHLKSNCKIQFSLHAIREKARKQIFGNKICFTNILHALEYLESIKYPKDKIDSKLILRDIAKDLGIKDRYAMRQKKAAQYGSKFDKGLLRLAKDFKGSKEEYLNSLDVGDIDKVYYDN